MEITKEAAQLALDVSYDIKTVQWAMNCLYRFGMQEQAAEILKLCSIEDVATGGGSYVLNTVINVFERDFKNGERLSDEQLDKILKRTVKPTPSLIQPDAPMNRAARRRIKNSIS